MNLLKILLYGGVLPDVKWLFPTMLSRLGQGTGNKEFLILLIILLLTLADWPFSLTLSVSWFLEV